MQTSFSDASWAYGPTGLGFANLVPGFAVWNYKANITVSDLNAALSVISTPSYQSAVYTETASVVNYMDTGGGGHFTPDNPFPGMPIGTDHNDFVMRAKGIIHVPTAGTWTFGVNSDDGFRLKITGATFNSAYGCVGHHRQRRHAGVCPPRSPADSLGVVNSLAAGDYNVELTYYERGGGSDTEFFAASGANTAWNSNFHLVGDTANGGLSVMSEPFTGGGSGSTFASLVQTNVKAAVQAAGNCHALHPHHLRRGRPASLSLADAEDEVRRRLRGVSERRGDRPPQRPGDDRLQLPGHGPADRRPGHRLRKRRRLAVPEPVAGPQATCWRSRR